jgi:excisionase family DNA binding protein
MDHPNSVSPTFGDIKTTCALYGCGKTLLYSLLRDKKIRARKLGSKTLIEFASVDEYFSTLPTYGEA